MSNEKEGKDTPKKAEWKPNPDITMDVKKGMDDWKTNSKIVMKLKESKPECDDSKE
jgi:hypothetical protein